MAIFTRPQPGRVLTTDDLLVFIEELEHALSGAAYGEGFVVENGGQETNIGLDLTAIAQRLKLRGTV